MNLKHFEEIISPRVLILIFRSIGLVYKINWSQEESHHGAYHLPFEKVASDLG